jgi:hypothetical protein
MRTTKTITCSVDEHRLAVLNALNKKIGGNLSSVIDQGIVLLLNHIGYDEKKIKSSEHTLNVLTNLKSLMDGVAYTSDEVLEMLKNGTISKCKAKTNNTLEEQLKKIGNDVKALNAEEKAINEKCKQNAAEVTEIDI